MMYIGVEYTARSSAPRTKLLLRAARVYYTTHTTTTTTRTFIYLDGADTSACGKRHVRSLLLSLSFQPASYLSRGPISALGRAQKEYVAPQSHTLTRKYVYIHTRECSCVIFVNASGERSCYCCSAFLLLRLTYNYYDDDCRRRGGLAPIAMPLLQLLVVVADRCCCRG